MSEMKFLKRIKGYTRGNRTRNVIMWIELNIEPLEEKVHRNTANLEDYLSIVDEDHVPRTLVNISLRDAIVWDSHWNAYEAELTCPKLVNWHHDIIKVIRNLHTCILLLITIISLTLNQDRFCSNLKYWVANHSVYEMTYHWWICFTYIPAINRIRHKQYHLFKRHFSFSNVVSFGKIIVLDCCRIISSVKTDPGSIAWNNNLPILMAIIVSIV